MFSAQEVTKTDLWSHLPAFLSALVSFFWFLLALAAFWKFKGPIKEAIDSRSLSVDIGGFKLSFAEATDGLKKQVSDLQERVSELAAGMTGSFEIGTDAQPREEEGNKIKQSVGLRGSDNTKDQIPLHTFQVRVLWVDDNPKGNAYEIASIQSSGGTVDTARSTAEGLARFQGEKYSTVITDMGRREDGAYNGSAGLELIRSIRTQDQRIPIFVYTATAQVKRSKAQVEAAGANGITSSSVELLEMLARSRSVLEP